VIDLCWDVGCLLILCVLQKVTDIGSDLSEGVNRKCIRVSVFNHDIYEMHINMKSTTWIFLD